MHEFVHVLVEMTGLDPPNVLSHEVIAHSITRCIQMTTRSPSEVFPDWSLLEKEGYSFLEEHAGLVSRKAVEQSWQAREPTAIGGAVADLHFFEIFGGSFPSSLDTIQLNEVEEYCRFVLSNPIDFEESSYFMY